MTLAEGKTAVEKYRNDHDTYVSIETPTMTHNEIHTTLMQELASAGYNSLEEFFEAVFWNNIDLICTEYNIQILIKDKEDFYNLIENVEGEINPIYSDIWDYWKGMWW